MTSTSFRFDIGTFHCTVVSDGNIVVPAPPRPGAPPGPGEAMDVSCLLVEAGGRRILVDTGCGAGFQASAGTLERNLRKEGIAPADIDTIIYTHGHEDHVAGTFDSAGRAVYPRARQVVSRTEWEAWANMKESDRHYRMFTSARRNLLPIADRFDLAEDSAEVLPGIRLVPAPGHTPGGAMVEIASGRDRLLCIGDLIHSRLEFADPEYYSFLDSIPDLAVKFRTEGLSKIADAGVLVFACHFPFPGIGRFVRSDGVLSWRPGRE